MKNNFSYLIILLSLLFHIQTGFTEDIEHQYHEDSYHENTLECEECTLKDHSTKTTNFSSNFDFSFDQSFQFNDNFLVRDVFSLGVAAYQSQAP